MCEKVKLPSVQCSTAWHDGMGVMVSKAINAVKHKHSTKPKQCIPFQKRLQQLELPSVHKPRPDCAVVGSSDLLRLYPLGREIDAYGPSWRVNHAPTKEFERLVGEKTTVRVVNHVVADVWSGKAKQKDGEFSIANSTEFPRNLCTRTVCIMIDNVFSPTMLRLSPNTQKILSVDCTKPASTGLIAVALALRVCEHVHMFGFFSECCNNPWLPDLNYKYYHTNKSSWVCCAGTRENMELEVAELKKHPRVSVHLVPQPRSNAFGPRCAVVGSAYSNTRWGAAIDAADRVYRVNHSPAGGRYGTMVGTRTDVRTLGTSTLEILSRQDLSERIEVVDYDLCSERTRCVFIAKYGDKRKYHNRSQFLLSKTRGIEEASNGFVTRSLLFKSQTSTKPFWKLKLSGGLATALLAREECRTVSVYYVETSLKDSCCTRKTPYSYFSSKNISSAARCCATSRELTDEYATWTAFGKLEGVALVPLSTLSARVVHTSSRVHKPSRP